MTNPKICNALLQLADIANCASGDFHLLHLNYKGAEFDTMHKKVLKKYYEQAAEDYDSLVEFALCYGDIAQNPNGSAGRQNYSSFEGPVDRQIAVRETNEILETLCGLYVKTFKALDMEDCPIAAGISNWLQGRLEYWGKELGYFNARRNDVTPGTE